MRAAAPALVAIFFSGLVIEAPLVSEGAPTIGADRAEVTLEAHARSASVGGPVREARAVHPTIPSTAAMRSARGYARARAGQVSYAFLDSDGKLRGRDDRRRYASASVVKVMLLAAEIHRLQRKRSPVDPATDELLTAMITSSDNEAADAIYARVGDPGLNEVAKLARMERFTVAGHWGNAQITALDMARLFGDLDRALAGPHREYALGLLGAIAPEQSWGVPEVAGPGWAVRFKGGWLPDRALVHQAAQLRERHGSRELSLAVLTDAQPSFDYGIETIEGIATRLLSR